MEYMEFDHQGEMSLQRRTISGDRRFNSLRGSHLQSQVMVGNLNECSAALICIVIGS